MAAARQTYRPFASFPDELCLSVTFHLQLHEVETLRAVSRRFAQDRPLCFRYQQLAATRWRDKHKTTMRPLLTRLLQAERAGRMTWRDIFWRIESDGARDEITEDEVVRLRWVFSDGTQTCDFRKDAITGEKTLHMQHHGVMPWRINDNATIQISRFPEHVVERLPSWGWVIKNQFIFIISIEGEAHGGGGGADSSAALSSPHAQNHAASEMTPSQINAAFLAAARRAGTAAAPLESGPLGQGPSIIHRILHAMFHSSEGSIELDGDGSTGDEDEDDEEKEEEEEEEAPH